MVFLTEQWLPILLSAVLVFIVSSVIHMALPIHKGDYSKIKNEDAVLESMRANDVEPGACEHTVPSRITARRAPDIHDFSCLLWAPLR